MPKSFEELTIWQISHQLTLEIYKIVKNFPLEEKYGLTDQLKRSAASVGANIAESHGRHHYADSTRFLYQARGSLQETRNHLMLARDSNYISPDEWRDLEDSYQGLARGLHSFIASIKKL